jgi:hypothetical protein
MIAYERPVLASNVRVWFLNECLSAPQRAITIVGYIGSMTEPPPEDAQSEIVMIEKRIRHLLETLAATESRELKASLNREIHMLEKRKLQAQTKQEEKRNG